MEKVKSIAEIKAIPFFSRFTDEQIVSQLKGNIQGLREMQQRAIKTGKKVGGYTAYQLCELAVSKEKLVSDYENSTK